MNKGTRRGLTPKVLASVGKLFDPSWRAARVWSLARLGAGEIARCRCSRRALRRGWGRLCAKDTAPGATCQRCDIRGRSGAENIRRLDLLSLCDMLPW